LFCSPQLEFSVSWRAQVAEQQPGMWTFFRDLERDELRRGRCYFERHCHGELRSYGLGFSDLVGLQSSKKLDGRTDQGSWFGQQLCDGHSQARTSFLFSFVRIAPWD
jgi:hypothetical protein